MTKRPLWIGCLALLTCCGDGAQAPAEPAAPGTEGVAGVAWADWETTPSGLQYFVVEEGKGERRARTGDQVTVHVQLSGSPGPPVCAGGTSDVGSTDLVSVQNRRSSYDEVSTVLSTVGR